MLKNNGWQEADIEEGFKEVSNVKEIKSDFQSSSKIISSSLNSNNITRINLTSLFSSFKFLVVISVVVLLLVGGGIYLWKTGFFIKNQEKIREQQINDSEKQEQQGKIVVEAPKFECKLELQKDSTIISGKVEFPIGIKNQTIYEALSYDMSSNKISSSGEFCVYGRKNAPFILGIGSPNEEDFPLMAVVNPFQININKNINVIVDAKSTAVALLFVTPYLMHDNSEKAAAIIAKIESNYKVIELAEKIKAKDNLSVDDIETGPISETFKESLQSVLNDIAKSN